MEHHIFITGMTYDPQDRIFKMEVEVNCGTNKSKFEATAHDLADALYIISNRIKSNIVK